MFFDDLENRLFAMMDKGFIERREHILAVALANAARQGWDHITVRDLCSDAGISMAEFYDVFEDKTDILIFYGRQLDRHVMATFPSFHPETPMRERLFDVLMERFDFANQQRDAVVSILNSMTTDPKQAVISMPHLGLSMTRMLELVGIDTQGIRGALRVAGLVGVYMWVVRTWIKDDTNDLSKTMAALDKALSRIDHWAQSYNL